MLVGSPVGLGDGIGVAGWEADGGGGESRGGRGAAVCVVRTGPGVDTGSAGRGLRRPPRSPSSGSAGAPGAGTRAGHDVPVAPGVRLGGSGGWVPLGRGTSTGPTEGVGMNGVLLSGRALWPTVADPVLIAVRIGMDAVPASSATVNR
ncbi:hypothetical protein GA0070604_0069 [Micromonospora eburnea]|uniref:Uncharacterized protein n=1 Tax=Micromonospora eburnea TaxID=227316 RepID=A0A1C6TQ58_9ACTN|nr:hypothetical protein GA0070604_0069 [Micromonospora eburnea]